MKTQEKSCFQFYYKVENFFKQEDSIPTVDQLSRAVFRKHLAFVITIALLIRLAFLYMPFFGLEYEDAFIFSDVGRAINNDYLFSYSPFQTKSCIDGSVSDCSSFGTYGGHFMIFPFIVASVNKIFGYHPFNIFWLNTGISLLMLGICCSQIRQLVPNEPFAMLASGLLLATVPFLSIFNTSGTSETFSSFVIILTIYIYLKARNRDFKNSLEVLLALTFISLACVVKRENMVLLAVPYLDAFFTKLENKKANITYQSVIAIAATLISLCVFFFVLKTYTIEAEESIGIAQQTFSFQYAILLLPTFINSLLDIRYFGIVGYFVLISPLLLFLTKKVEIRLLLIISWLYLLLYSFHYRGYYFVKYQEVSTFDTLRYYTNFFPLLLIPFLAVLFSKTYKLKKSGAVISTSVLLIITFHCTISITTRKELSQAEKYERIHPVTETLKLLDRRDVIMTNIPIIFRILSPTNQHIIDYNSLDKLEENKIDALKKGRKVYILKNKQDDDRYSESLKVLNKLKTRLVLEISDRYILEQVL